MLKVSEIYRKADEEIILNKISFTLKRFQKLAIAGETGSGKSTLLKTIAGLAQPDSGEVLLDDQRVSGPEETLVPGHRHIVYLSQHFELRKFLRVEQILSYSSTLKADEAQQLYEVCRIDTLLKRRTDALSGGEKQRIALANLLLASPQLLLLDEPFSNLDRIHKSILQGVIDDITTRLKITVILVSHDPGDILSWADQVIVLKSGSIAQQGTPEKVYHRPADQYCAALFGKYTTLDSEQRKILSAQGELAHIKKTTLLRPEHLRFVSRKQNALAAVVQSINFFGSHYDVDVLHHERVMTIRISEPTVVVGQTVYVSLSPVFLRQFT